MVFLKRLWIQMTADRKRFAALCAVLALGMLLWARLILVSKLPRTALADDPAGTAAASAAGAEPGDPSDGSATRPSDKPALPPVPIRLARTADRDPFVINPEFFPKPNLTGDIGHDAGKSAIQPVEDAQAAEARRLAQLRTLADRFRLEAVMQGNPMAVINGRTYRLMDWIGAVEAPGVQFRLVEVQSRAAVIACDGYRFELTIQDPMTSPR
jgi:hypothetical protein